MKNIEELLNKYFEGETSLEEEKLLKVYFQQTNLPESMKIYKPMFEFFISEKGEVDVAKKPIRSIWIRWASVAAACLLLFLGIKFTFDNTKSLSAQSMVYIDGKKYTDMQTIQSNTLDVLEVFSSSEDDVISSQIDMLESFNDF